MRSQENVLAIAESRVIYRVDYIGAERGDSTMESLQQATDGDGQRRKRTEVSRERRHTEEVHRGQTGNRTRDSPQQALPALRSTGPPETCIGPKISTSFRKKSKKTKTKTGPLSAGVPFLQQQSPQCQFRQWSETSRSAEGDDGYTTLRHLTRLSQSRLYHSFRTCSLQD